MKKRGFSWVDTHKQLVYLLTLVSLCLPVEISKVQAQEVSEEATSQLSQTPPTNKPIKVAVGLYLINFDKFSEEDDALKLDAYMFLTWKDKRLAFKPNQLVSTKNYELGEIWSPTVTFTNIQFKRETAYTELKVKPDGTVEYKERFTGEFSSDAILQSFPFDSQKIKLILEPLDNLKNVNFVVDESKTGKAKDASLAGWGIGEDRASITTKNFEIDKANYPEFVYEINITRYYSPYIWNIIIPLLLIVGISWTVFWSKSFEANVVISFSSLLSAIAFNILIAAEMPKVAYLTFISGFTLTTYIFISATVVYVVLKHYLEMEKQHELAFKSDLAARWLFPVLFGTSNLVLIAIFLL